MPHLLDRRPNRTSSKPARAVTAPSMRPRRGTCPEPRQPAPAAPALGPAPAVRTVTVAVDGSRYRRRVTPFAMPPLPRSGEGSPVGPLLHAAGWEPWHPRRGRGQAGWTSPDGLVDAVPRTDGGWHVTVAGGTVEARLPAGADPVRVAAVACAAAGQQAPSVDWELLAGHPDPRVRAYAAGHPGCPDRLRAAAALA